MKRAQQMQIWRASLERDFWLFFLYGFGARYYCLENPTDNWVWYPLHSKICRWLGGLLNTWMDYRRSGIRKRMNIMLEIFRGGGKSTIGAAIDIYLTVRDPNLAEVISSYDIKKSREFLTVSKTTLEGKAKYGWFKNLWGVYEPIGDNMVWQKEEATHNRRTNRGLRDPSFLVTSVSRGMTGSRPDVFRLDDPIVEEKLNEEKNWVAKAKTHVKSSVYALKTNGLRVLYLTPYLEGDVADRVWQEEGVAEVAGQEPPFDYKHNPDGWHVFYMPIRDLKTGKSVMPNVYPDEELNRMEKDDPEKFSAQMMCNPAAGSHMPLTMKDIKYLWVAGGSLPKWLDVSIHCDTAFKDHKSTKSGDRNVIQEWGHDRSSGKVYYLDGWVDREAGAREFMTELVHRLKARWIERNFPFVVTVDKDPGGTKGSFENQLFDACRRALIPCPPVLELNRTRTVKDSRIRGTVYYWKNGHVRLSRRAGAVQDLIYEMTHIGYSAHMDMADAASDVFHPEVYAVAPEVGAGKKSPDVGRPFDGALWSSGRPLSDEELRAIYDAQELPDVEAAVRERIVE